MRLRMTAGVVCLILLAILTWLRWDLISSASLSLAGFVFFSVRNLFPAVQFWAPSLGEYWIALAGWVATAAVLLWWIAEQNRRPVFRVLAAQTRNVVSKRISLVALLFMVFVAICTPFIVPVDPTVQGDLTTTRLLPPLATGELTVKDVGPSIEAPQANSFEGTVRQAMRRLLSRSCDLRGPGSGTAGTLLTHPSSRGFCFLLGTDDVGRDVLSRVLAGTRISLLVGGTAAVGAVFLGALIGLVAGMSKRVVDSLLMRFTDLFLALPSIILVIGMVAFMGQSVGSLVAVLSLTGWMSTARIVRGEVHVLREKEFIAAAKLLGTTPYGIMVGHLLPNVWPILATSAVLQFGSAMLGEAALSFLGLGIQAPTASWGNMIGESISYVSIGWWVGLFPGVLLSGAVLATHVLVDE
jgi:peptide/nickel transport system permease protein